MNSKDINAALSTLLDTAYHAISNLQGSREEALEFADSKVYSDAEYLMAVEDIDNEINHIKEAADVILDFKIILNRHNRVVSAMSEVNNDIASIFSFDA